ncbi:MAG: trypsin-like serine protease [Gemmatimonadetes bacterium]|nr:trypsin-like serine protease [Gemmatimonadota bacterium]
MRRAVPSSWLKGWAAAGVIAASALTSSLGAQMAPYINTAMPSPQFASQPGEANWLQLVPWHARNLLVVAGDPNSPAYATPKGAGYDGIGSIFIDIGNGTGYLCTGSLLQGGYMLTAAHCLSDGKNVFAAQTFSVFFPPGTPSGTQEIITSTQFYVHPQYTGEVIDAHDIAIIKLGSAPSAGVQAAALSLYSGGGAVGSTAQLVGSGATGDGVDQGGGGFGLGDRRTGLNAIDFNWNDPLFGGFFNGFFGNADPGTLIADFDSGRSGNNASCWMASFFTANLAPYCGLGFGGFEANLGPGDSGGPLFINGLIAGVASYGLSFGAPMDPDNTLNSSYGEFAGWTSVEYNRAWINSVIAPPQQVVPEPATVMLTFAGLALMAGMARRRRS